MVAYFVLLVMVDLVALLEATWDQQVVVSSVEATMGWWLVVVLFVFAPALAMPWYWAAENLPLSFAETVLDVSMLVDVGKGLSLHSWVHTFGNSPNPWRKPVV